MKIDAHSAVISHDARRAVDDLNAMDNISKQLRRTTAVFFDQHMAVAALRNEVESLGEALEIHPALFDDATLIDYAHRLSGPRVAGDLYSLAGERTRFLDIAQRFYTDDGNGDGRMAGGGAELLRYFGEQRYGKLGMPVLTAMAPAMMVAQASRKETIARYDEYLDDIKAGWQKPLREVGVSRPSAAQDFNRFRYPLLSLLTDEFHYAARTAELYFGSRDGVITAIALELYHRHHGTYPATLDELVPGYLPEVPADRVDGKPLRYRLSNGRPLIYSVGDDGDDDGGRTYWKSAGQYFYPVVPWVSAHPVDCDRVLWPPPKHADK